MGKKLGCQQENMLRIFEKIVAECEQRGSKQERRL
jgi:hypothetical protein